MIFLWLACAPTPTTPTPFEGITHIDLERHVRILASDEYMGRGTLEPGIEKAADYIAAEFKRIGLQPIDGNSEFRAPFTMYQGGFEDSTSMMLTNGDSSANIALDQWRVFPFSDEGSLEAEVVFAGYGITAEEYQWDDYANLDVTDKIVLVLRREMGADDPESSFAGTETTDHSLFSSKAMNAVNHGAKGMIPGNRSNPSIFR